MTFEPPANALERRRPAWASGLVALAVAAAAGQTLMGNGHAEPVGKGGAGASSPASRPSESGPHWETLSSTQKSDLAPLQKDWPALDAGRKEKWLVLARRFSGMSETERERIRMRMNEWVQMTPLERGRARQTFQEMQIGRAEDRQALWDAYQALPAEERNQLAQRARPASSSTNVARAASNPGELKPLSGNKRNIVQAQVQTTPPKPISPTAVQAKPGATTTLLTTKATPPAHNQPGLPKIAATEGFVNPSTLLPRRGPQGAAARSAASPASSPLQQ